MKTILPAFLTRKISGFINGHTKWLLSFLFICTGIYAQSQVTQTFTSSGTFTAPTAAGVTSVTVEAWGAGGGGGSNTGRGRGGGGGGAYARSIVPVTGGTSYSVVVGLPGAVGGNGGNSSFNINSVVAAGGTASPGIGSGQGGSVAASIGTILFAGGNGGTSTGSNNHGGGGGGGSAFTNSPGNNGAPNVTGTGGLGGTGTGTGGNGGNNLVDGMPGNAPGGGGGGRGNGAISSGTGARGEVKVTYTCFVYSINSVSATNICLNSSSTVSLTSVTGLPVGTYTVTYDLGGANTASGLTANMVVTSAGTGSFNSPSLSNAGVTTLTITNLASGPCGNAITLNNSTSFTVMPVPVTTISGTTQVCRNQPDPVVTFTNGQAYPVTVTYNINGGTVQTIDIPAGAFNTVTASSIVAGVYNYNLVSVEYQSAPVCTNSLSGSATITVYEIPTGVLSSTETSGIAANDNIICNGEAVNFSATAGFTNYDFKVNGVSVQSSSSEVFTYSFSANSTVSVDVTNADNCVVTFNTIDIVVNPTPVATFISAPSSITCEGTQVTYTTQAGQANYTWTVPGTNGIEYTIISGALDNSSNSVTIQWLLPGTYTVTVSYTNANNCVSTTASGTTTMYVLPQAFNVTGGGNYCADLAGLMVSLDGSEAGVNYQLYLGAVPIGSPVAGNGAAIDFGLQTQAGSYTVVATSNVSGCQQNMTGNAVIGIYTRPTGSLSGSTTICNGGSTILSIAVIGTGTISGTLSDGTPFSGTAPVIAVSVSPSVTTNYTISTLLDDNCSSVASDISGNATVTVNEPVVITSQPAATQTVCSSTSASFSVLATGTGVTYKWFRGATPINNGGRFSGATSATLTISPVNVTDAASDYKVVVYGSAPCDNDTSDLSTLIVNQEIFFTQQPVANQLVCEGITTVISADASGTGPFTYQWYKNGVPFNTGVSGTSDATSVTTSITFSPVSVADAGNYTVTVNSASGVCTQEISDLSVLGVNTISADPISATASQAVICNGQSTVLTLNGGGGGTGETIRWYTSSCGGSLVGTGNDLLVSPSVTTTYYGRYETGAPCSQNSVCADVTITVTQPSADPVSATATELNICNGQSTVLTLSGGGGGTGETIRWYSSSCGGTLAGTGNDLSVSPSVTTTYYGRYETGAPCSQNTICASVTITVNTASADPVSATASSTTICNGQSTQLLLNGGGGGTGETIRWYTTSCGGTLVGSGNNLSVSPSVTTTYYGRYETTAPCNQNSICREVTITVNQPSADPLSGTAVPSTICSSQPSTLTLNGGGGGTGEIIHWYTSSCGGTLAGTGNNLVVTPTLTTTYYGRYETSAPCSQNTACIPVTVTVNQVAGNPTSATASVGTICAGQSTILTLNGGGGGTGTVVNWYTSSCGGTLVGTGNNLSVSPSSTTTYYGRYETSAPCSQNTICMPVMVTVNQPSADPVSATASSTSICGGQSTVLTLNGGGGGTGETIRWYTSSCGGTLVGTGNNLSVTPSVTTTYYGRYETSAPCSQNTVCRSVTITVSQTSVIATTATASPSTICQGNSTTLTLNGGSSGSGAVIRWYTSSCGGTLVGTGNNLSVSPSVTTTYFGRFEDPAPCNTNTGCRQVTVNVNPPATANAGTPLSLCGDPVLATPAGATSINITAGSSASNYSSILWSSSGTGTFTNANSLTLATYTPSAADRTAGSVTITLRANGLTGCSNVTSTKTLTLGKTITNNTIVLSSVCKAGSGAHVVISQGPAALAGGDGNFTYQWYFSTPGNSNYQPIPGETGLTISLPQGAHNGFYRRMVYSGGCSSESNQIHVNANNVFLSNTFSMTGGGAYCASNPAGVPIGMSGSIDGGGVFIVTYQLFRDGVYTGVSVNGTGSAFNFPNQTIPGTYTVQVVVSVAGGATCAPQNITGSVVVSIDAAIPAATVSANQQLCNVFTASITGSDPSPFTGAWTLVSGSGIIASPSTPSTSVSGLGIGDNIFKWKIENGTCKDSANVTVRVDPPLSFTAQPTETIYCVGQNITLSATVTGQSPVMQWMMSTDGGATFNPITNNATYSGATTNTLQITGPTLAMTGYLYSLQVSVTGACAGTISSAPVAIYQRNLWVGNISSDWNNAANWAGNALPSTVCSDVFIPSGRPNQPLLSSGTATITNIIIASGATLTVSNAILQIAGTINNSGVFNAINGTIDFNGTAPQTIAANTFQANSLKDLTVSNTAGSLTLAGDLNLFGKLSFTGTGKSLITNDYLTLRSTETGTAYVSAIAVDGSGNALNFITGNVMVERYISAKRAWRLLSIPTNTTQTTKQTWQENQPANNTSLSGYGVHITSERLTWAADGFDLRTPNGSTMKIYNAATDFWDGIARTHDPIKTDKGYMLLVRGDRTVNAFGQAPTPTILRTKGPLYTGKRPAHNVAADQFTVVGNPYASAINFTQVAKTGGVQDVYYMWDPKLGSSLGGYQTFIGPGPSYFVVPGGGSYASGETNIESGSAFLVRAVGSAGTVTFEESSKTEGSRLVTREANVPVYIKTTLSGIADNTTTVLDGTINLFNDSYSSNVDRQDVLKVSTLGETISIKNGGKNLTGDMRPMPQDGDTIHFGFGQLRYQPYQLEIEAAGLPEGMTAILIDNFNNTLNPLNEGGSTVYPFAVTTDPATYPQERFRIVFKRSAVPQVKFTSISARRTADQSANIQWKVINESNVTAYSIERSEDGRTFTGVGERRPDLNPGGRAIYNQTDADVSMAKNYYRIKSTSVNGVVSYSAIAQVEAVPVQVSVSAGIAVFPNPVTDGNMTLSLREQPTGKYDVMLYSNNGQLVHQSVFYHNATTGKVQVKLDAGIVPGTYKLVVSGDIGNKTSLTILIK